VRLAKAPALPRWAWTPIPDAGRDPSCFGNGAGLALIGFALSTSGSAANLAIPKPPVRGLSSLKSVPVPEPANIGDFIQDKTAATQLGKALFWDVQVGSDGATACATCHFQAGADSRTKNQLNPGPDGTFQVHGPNAPLAAADFPLHKLSDANNPASVVSDKNDVVGSQGVLDRQFTSPQPSTSTNPMVDACTTVADPIFHVGPTDVRRVTGRNAPTAVDAVFNMRNFWDGRAQDVFNGVDPLGARNPDAHVFKLVGRTIQPVAISLQPASLASQATGPGLSPTEMSCNGRTWADIGDKLFSLTPLNKQVVDPTDSVLGSLANTQKSSQATGLSTTYQDLIKKAFQPAFWSGTDKVTLNGVQFTQMEANFSLFWGLAIQAYESTLVADQTPVDQFFDGGGTLSPQALNGMNIFTGRAKCIECHGGPELTNASVANVQFERLERMENGNGGCTLYDTGFYNIGVRPTSDDPGLGGTDPFGNPLSEAKMVLLGKLPNVAAATTPPLGSVPNCDSSANVDGSFKAPGLRNVELTGPYFHNGGKSTLRQVVDFYSRGGDFAAQNAQNLDGEIKPLGLTDTDKDALVAFLLALTDERVRWQRAPFDHPSLCVPNGERGDTSAVETTPDGLAADAMMCIPQTGIGGAPAPLQPFLGLDPTQATGIAPTPTPTPTTPPTATPTTAPTSTPTPTATTNLSGLPSSALLQGDGSSSVVTSQPTATPTSTPAPSNNDTSSSSSATSTPTPTSVPSSESKLQQQLSQPVPDNALASNGPGVASVSSGPSASSASSAPAQAPAAGSAPVSGASSGLPPSAIFTPPLASVQSSLAEPVFVVVASTAGGVLALADGSVSLMIPAGVADTDLLTVSLAEVDPTSAAANLQVGNRAFLLTAVDSGGGTITSFAAPISLTAQPGGPDLVISALDPDSGQFVALPADGTTVALDRLGTPEPTLSIVSAPSRNVQAKAAAPAPVGGIGDAASSIARSLGLIP
jgi:cytochrome c peroxidase